MTSMPFRVGASFPTSEIGTDADAIRDFAQAIEDLGYSHLCAYDHVVGANTASRPDWTGPYTHLTPFHEPLTLFSYLAGVTRRLGFVTCVIILPQRQTVLFAKQAANLDIFCKGRLRVGVGAGWNEVEYEALGVPFARRGARLDDQIRFLRRLWTEPAFTEDGAFHRITDAGINPLPLQGAIPIWIGGWSEAAMMRAVRLGQGWMPSLDAAQAGETVGAFHAALKTAGRDPAAVGLENMVLLGSTIGGPRRDAEAAVADAEAWRKAGATGVNIDTMSRGLKSVDEHIELFRRVAEMLQLSKPA
jgi:probable F420-dependent oxidoreductase